MEGFDSWMETFFKPVAVKANVPFHWQDGERTGIATKDREFRFTFGVHASYAQLAGWPSANAVKLSPVIKARMYLSHVQDFVAVGDSLEG